MKKSRFTEEQIVAILKEAEAGLSNKEICRKHGIANQAFYHWKAKYGGMNVSDVKRLKALEDENAQLKRGRHSCARHRGAEERSGQKSGLTTSQAREAVDALCEVGISERHACGVVGLPRSTRRRESTKNDTPLCERIIELAQERRRFGYRRITALLQREGKPINHKRVYRIYREENLQVRKRNRKKLRIFRKPLKSATGPNQRWSLDFVSDSLASERRYRTLNWFLDLEPMHVLALKAGVRITTNIARIVRLITSHQRSLQVNSISMSCLLDVVDLLGAGQNYLSDPTLRCLSMKDIEQDC